MQSVTKATEEAFTWQASFSSVTLGVAGASQLSRAMGRSMLANHTAEEKNHLWKSAFRTLGRRVQLVMFERSTGG